MVNPLIIRARDALERLTPLNTNCGTLCGARCCQSGDNGEGMCLFPTEEHLYAHTVWARISDSSIEGVKLLLCDGTCPRGERPLACRIFPLTPYIKEGGLRIRMDPRARPMCPLYDSGARGLDAYFVKTVRNVMRPLLAAEEQRTYLERLTGLIDEYERWYG